MKQIIAMLALLVLLAGCIPDKEKPIVGITAASPITVDQRNVTLNFKATDNRDLLINYVVFIDTTQVKAGVAQNNTLVSVELELPDKDTSLVRVAVTDKYLNVGSDQIIVNLRDSVPPIVTIISVVPR